MEKQFEEILYSRYQARIRDMKILKVDEGFEQILGYSAEDVERLQLYVKDIMLDEDDRTVWVGSDAFVFEQ